MAGRYVSLIAPDVLSTVPELWICSNASNTSAASSGTRQSAIRAGFCWVIGPRLTMSVAAEVGSETIGSFFRTGHG